MPEAVTGILHDLSSNSSTISLFQVIDKDLLSQIEENLCNTKNQIIIDQTSLELKTECINKYPVLYERLLAASSMFLSDGIIPESIKLLYAEILKFTLKFYAGLEETDR